jgi:hypothetical protein
MIKYILHVLFRLYSLLSKYEYHFKKKKIAIFWDVKPCGSFENRWRRSFETSVLTEATRRNIPEDGIVPSHGLENLKSYMALTGWAL